VRRFAVIAASAVFLLIAGDAHACRTYLHNTRLAIRSQVETLGVIEARLLYRLMGGHWPPFEQMAQDARAALAVIYPRNAALTERRLRHCRNWVPPVRRTCGAAAARLINVIEDSAARRPSETSRLEYARLIAQCERWLWIPSRSSFLRMP
jgi:hypothetical protein